ncbi:DUF4177 domain-containing protein [Citreimonas salinaria]|uniref:DUF4177 domain-containing protein n=1 Tax=Citreimonas salinaria TaxID=321339 RepID=A0A1H3G0G3_9RHOB|nr:DUF4177 domain-containing protein [Citreimonas salinaria]SDX96812.1 protein of unknown function [Citreimonas salinaria]
MSYEYKIVPAPERGEKERGLKTPEARFAAAVERVINEMAAKGWEYQRTDALPSEERAGLTHTQTVWRHLLVFRRSTGAEQAVRPAAPVTPLVQAQPAAAHAAHPVPAEQFADEPQEDVQVEPIEGSDTGRDEGHGDADRDASGAEAESRPKARLTATRDGPRRKPRFAPPREDPAIAAPVRKLFAGPPQGHALETHPNDPRLTRDRRERRREDD